MTARAVEIGGLHALVTGDDDAARVVVILHGRQMAAADLAAFGDSLQLPARFVFPDGPIAVAPRGRSWWEVDSETRLRARAHGGGMELATLVPAGREAARAKLHALVTELGADKQVILVGFSQGGMLAMDYVLHAEHRVAALGLLSSSRIAFDDWSPRLAKLAGLPVFVAHGRGDAELAFTAGEGLRDAAIAGGAAVTWLPFDGGHELPLVVWRALRKWILRR
jgi:phospholipase/carboxylesterase